MEEIPKADVERALAQATAHCQVKGRYSKGRHSFTLLAAIDPSRVEGAAPHARRLLVLRQKLAP